MESCQIEDLNLNDYFKVGQSQSSTKNFTWIKPNVIIFHPIYDKKGVKISSYSYWYLHNIDIGYCSFLLLLYIFWGKE